MLGGQDQPENRFVLLVHLHPASMHRMHPCIPRIPSPFAPHLCIANGLYSVCAAPVHCKRPLFRLRHACALYPTSRIGRAIRGHWHGAPAACSRAYLPTPQHIHKPQHIIQSPILCFFHLGFLIFENFLIFLIVDFFHPRPARASCDAFSKQVPNRPLSTQWRSSFLSGCRSGAPHF